MSSEAVAKPTDLILAVDIGTSAVKAVLFDSEAQQVALVRRAYPVLQPHEGWGEQEPQVIYEAVLAAMKAAVELVEAGQTLRGISFSSQMYSVLAVDGNGRILTNSITWSDTRSTSQAQMLRQHEDSPGIVRRTGCPIDALFPLAKIQWLKEHHPLPVYTRFISIKEYVIFRLTGHFVTDWSLASATGMLDVKRRRWDDRALNLVQITPANLSNLVSPRQELAITNQEVLADLGLSAEIPLIIGSGDAPLSSIGAGAFAPNVLTVNVGTSAAARLLIPQPSVDASGGLWTFVADEQLWVTGGLVSCGGIVFDWFLNNWFDEPKEQARQSALQSAAAAPPGADNLLFIPYLRGEQSPDWQPATRGSFHGLALNHSRGHMSRAVLEGITRAIYRAVERIKVVADTSIHEIRITGGVAASPLWQQIAADMLGVTVVVPATVEGSARGAAMLAMLALGMNASYAEFPDQIEIEQRVQPQNQIHQFYQQQYHHFQHYLDFSRNNQPGG